MCSLSRYVVIGGFTAMAAATATGSDLVGGLAAVVAVALTVLAGRRWPAHLGGASCALPAALLDTDTPVETTLERDERTTRDTGVSTGA